MAPTSYFTASTLDFLSELRNHNDRDWFNANKARYEENVKEPFLEFIDEVGPKLRKLSPHIVADSRPVGGSFFRIYRDVRFSKDKSPYKTHAAAHFSHAATNRDVHGPGYYLHIEPGNCGLAGGMWQPEPKALLQIRKRIVRDPNGWRAVVKKVPDMEGEKLVRPPTGFSPDHPLIEDIKRKDFVAWLRLEDSEVTSAGLPALFVSSCRKIAPLMQFLAKAINVSW
ncbi:MAG: DUF2461 domain-containing protein [Actinomycetota bacterium]|nr:DUF2461 domain-containing protein [Actinomycetota bacterium]